MLRPLAGFRECLLVCRCEWFVVNGGVRNRAGDGIKQAFEHTNRCGHLFWSQVLDQFVGMLFVCRHNKIILHVDSKAVCFHCKYSRFFESGEIHRPNVTSNLASRVK
jgi:hypothetical protein